MTIISWIPLLRPTPVEPTYSVVELSKPRDLTAPDPEEVTNTEHVPGAALETVEVEGKKQLVNKAFDLQSLTNKF